MAYKFTEEHKRRISEANKGRIISKEHRAKISKSNKGKIISEECRKKLSEAMKGKKKTEEHKRKISAANKGQVPWSKGLTKETDERVKRISEKCKGRKVSEVNKKKLSESWKGEGNPNYGKFGKDHPRFGHGGKEHYMYGKHHSTETKAKLRAANKCGKDHPNWNGGRSASKNDKLRNSYASRKTNKETLIRDDYTCRTCKISKVGELHCHHICKFSEYPELRFVTGNKITLCKKCHKATEGIEEQMEKMFYTMNVIKETG